MRIVVIGSRGQLGSNLVDALNAEKHEVVPLQRTDIECCDPESVQLVLERVEPEVVVNCAALTDVDMCQDRPEDAFRINALGALYVAQCCARVGSLCVYTSTDFVFDGEKGDPYTEDDCPNPTNVYGASKLVGEMLTRQASPECLIVRMSSLFGKSRTQHTSRNFVDRVIEKARIGEALRIVDDIWMSPTYAWDASRALEWLVRQRATGIFHLTNAGRCSWYEFAERIFHLVGLSPVFEAIPSREYRYRARRPRDSSLRRRTQNDRLDVLLRPWQQALGAYLDGQR